MDAGTHVHWVPMEPAGLCLELEFGYFANLELQGNLQFLTNFVATPQWGKIRTPQSDFHSPVYFTHARARQELVGNFTFHFFSLCPELRFPFPFPFQPHLKPYRSSQRETNPARIATHPSIIHNP